VQVKSWPIKSTEKLVHPTHVVQQELEGLSVKEKASLEVQGDDISLLRSDETADETSPNTDQCS
jgi:hypothetical protein